MNEDKIKRLTEWLATPKGERVPKMQKELATELEVSEPELSNLKQKLELFDAPPTDVKTLYDHILNEAKKKNCSPGIARIAWEMVNPDKKEIKEAEFTANDYTDIGARLIEQLREQHKQSGGSCPICGVNQTIRNEVCNNPEPKYKED